MLCLCINISYVFVDDIGNRTLQLQEAQNLERPLAVGKAWTGDEALVWMKVPSEPVPARDSP